MSSFVDLVPGTRLNVTPPGDPAGATYECTVRQVTTTGMRLSTPRRDSVPLELEPDDVLTMFTLMHGRLYRFQSAVRHIEYHEHDSITVDLPDEAERTERRAYFRLVTRIVPRLAVHLDDAGKVVAPLSSVVLDLSGGGLLLQTRELVPAGDRIRLVMELAGDPLPLDIVAQVLSVSRPAANAQHYRANCQFMDLDRNERERVVRFIFRQQAEMRRKGVM